MFERFMFQASTFAGQIDGLFWLIFGLVGFWLLIAEGLLFWLVLKFKARPGVRSEYLVGSEAHIKRWISIPHFLIILCDLVIVVFSLIVWTNIKLTLPEADTTVRAIGQQWAWVFQHPGRDNELDTADDIYTVDDLFVERGKTYHVQMESRDVLHSFSVAAFRLKQDVIPGRRITGWFEATVSGTYDVQCAEICGLGHGSMYASIHIEDQNQHADWIARNSTSADQ